MTTITIQKENQYSLHSGRSSVVHILACLAVLSQRTYWRGEVVMLLWQQNVWMSTKQKRLLQSDFKLFQTSSI